ncbi:MarR family winged helix-turn-helix transcriptional regulator [Nocardioides albus]|uniref:DNA-binding MarR family transcriptional regulator n=1 Tax=Nocardioides albus TaxID=1841 RepID=A0A7W5F6Z3_9ACTN|nr:MarR family winged helix-turn-helix transcriptional regulator [Nocardioides albus]MBB3087653.1 DNA-binding MarR family transcriptional regulator [Nocardioides albus]GGU10510.1 MarR family transcriptional regulator [Nocardioides albus]
MTATDESAESDQIDATRVEALIRLEAELGVFLRRGKRAMSARGRMLHPDLPPGGYMLLTWLAEHGPVRASALVDGLGIDKGAVSRMVQTIIDLGLLERHPDPEDGRASLVSVTVKAREGLDRVARERRVRFNDRLADWSPDDIDQLSGMLSRYNEALERQGS